MGVGVGAGAGPKKRLQLQLQPKRAAPATLVFVKAGAGAGEKIIWSQSRSKQTGSATLVGRFNKNWYYLLYKNMYSRYGKQ